jgi:hypothetical protein
MSDAKKKVLEMVEQKKITAAEGDALLAAMRAAKRFSFLLLVDPFERVSTFAMLAIGAVAAGLSVLIVSGLGLPPLKSGGIRFDGFMDVHMPAGAVGVPLAVGEQLAVWPLSALALWLVALAFERKSRLVDFLAVTGLARAVMLVGGVLISAVAPPSAAMAELAKNAVANPGAALGAVSHMIPMAAIALVFLGWFITASVFGFRHASSLRGEKLAGAFVLALVLAETVSKVALWGFSLVVGS